MNPEAEAPEAPAGAAEASFTLLSPSEINDLRRRVLAGEAVSDDELHSALAALSRPLPDGEKKPKKASSATPKLDTVSLLASMKKNVEEKKA